MRRRDLAVLVRLGLFVAIAGFMSVSSAEPTKGDAGASATLPSEDEDPATDAGASKKDAGTAGDASAPSQDAAPGVDAAPGTDGGAALPTQGQLLISEVMFNPAGTEPESEWIEIHNPTSAPLLLSGLVLRDGASPANEHTIGAGVVVPAGAYVLLVADAAAAVTAKLPAAAIVYEYAGAGVVDPILLGNSTSGAVVLARGATEIARARYGALGYGGAGNGRSVQLSVLTYAASGQSASWCVSATTWAGSTEMGTPGAPSDCP